MGWSQRYSALEMLVIQFFRHVFYRHYFIYNLLYYILLILLVFSIVLCSTHAYTVGCYKQTVKLAMAMMCLQEFPWPTKPLQELNEVTANLLNEATCFVMFTGK